MMKPKIDLVSMLLVNVDGRALVPVVKKRKAREVSLVWCQLRILQLNGSQRILSQVYIKFFISFYLSSIPFL